MQGKYWGRGEAASSDQWIPTDSSPAPLPVPESASLQGVPDIAASRPHALRLDPEVAA